jgi:hypothetical protein
MLERRLGVPSPAMVLTRSERGCRVERGARIAACSDPECCQELPTRSQSGPDTGDIKAPG